MKRFKTLYDWALGVIKEEPETNEHEFTVLWAYDDFTKEELDSHFDRWTNHKHTNPINIIDTIVVYGGVSYYSGHFRAENNTCNFDDDHHAEMHYYLNDFPEAIILDFD